MKKITPLLCFKACLRVAPLSFSDASAQDIISKAFPNMSVTHLDPTRAVNLAVQ